MGHGLNTKNLALATIGIVVLSGIIFLGAVTLDAFGPKRVAFGPSLPELVPVSIHSEGQPGQLLTVAKFEVTHAQWNECVEQGGCSYQPKTYPYTRPNHPVSGVSWFDVQQYLTWISRESGKKFRLPTESEWKILAADILAKQDAGTKLFDDPRMEWANDYRFFSQRAPRKTQPIGYYGENSTGIADLDGNVWEWTGSCWSSRDNKNPAAIVTRCKGWRVLAGTHITYIPEFIRHVPIGGCSIGYPPANIGFRVVLDESITEVQTL